MTEALEEIRERFFTTRDAIRVTRRIVEKGLPGITKRHVFHGLNSSDTEVRLAAGLLKIEQLAIFELIAAFEKMLRNAVDLRVSDNLDFTDPTILPIHANLRKSIESWRFSEDLLDSFPFVDKQVSGEIKQFIKFRNWLAHGRFIESPPEDEHEFNRVFQVLSNFIQQANIT